MSKLSKHYGRGRKAGLSIIQELITRGIFKCPASTKTVGQCAEEQARAREKYPPKGGVISRLVWNSSKQGTYVRPKLEKR